MSSPVRVLLALVIAGVIAYPLLHFIKKVPPREGDRAEKMNITLDDMPEGWSSSGVAGTFDRLDKAFRDGLAESGRPANSFDVAIIDCLEEFSQTEQVTGISWAPTIFTGDGGDTRHRAIDSTIVVLHNPSDTRAFFEVFSGDCVEKALNNHFAEVARDEAPKGMTVLSGSSAVIPVTHIYGEGTILWRTSIRVKDADGVEGDGVFVDSAFVRGHEAVAVAAFTGGIYAFDAEERDEVLAIIESRIDPGAS